MTHRAEKLFADFHKYEAEEIKAFPSSFRIPERAPCVGPALYVLYRSAKCDPITYLKPDKPIDYIHEHKPGVKVYILDSSECEGPVRSVPKYIHEADTLVLLGKCLGFAYSNVNGDEENLECTSCELYSIPNGKALLVVEKKREVLAMIWGGKLNVEPRGIVG